MRPWPATHWLGLRGVRGWGPVTNPTARALACWLGALWGRQEGARGRRLLPGCGVSGVGRSPIPDHSSFRACGRGSLPTGYGCWGLRAWGPLTNSTARALASWLCALWGRHEGAVGGRLLPGCGASGVRRSPNPDHSSFRACGRGPLPTGCWCGGCGRGDPSSTPRRALLCAGLVRFQGGMRAPGGGASCLSAGRPGSGALPTPTTRPFGREAGAHYPLAVGAGGAGVGTSHQPHSARSCKLALWAVGAAGGGPGWGRLLAGCGTSGVGCSPTPDHPSFEACGWGPLPTGCECGGCRRGDQSPTLQRALLRAGLARCLDGTRAPGGGASCLSVGRPWSGALPAPTTRPFGRAAGAHYPLAVVAGAGGVGTSHQPHSARSCKLALRAMGAARGPPGGGSSCLGVRRPGSDTLPPPTTRPFGRAAGAHYPLAVGGGGRGRGHPSSTPQSALL